MKKFNVLEVFIVVGLSVFACSTQGADQAPVAPVHVGVQWHLSAYQKRRLWDEVIKCAPNNSHVSTVDFEAIDNLLHTLCRDGQVSLGHLSIPERRAIGSVCNRAVRLGYTDFIEFCFEHGYRPDRMSEFETQLWPLAILCENHDSIRLFERYEFEYQRTVLDPTSWIYSYDVANGRESKSFDSGNEVLCAVSPTGTTVFNFVHYRYEMLKFLLENGAHKVVNQQDYLGHTALHRIFSAIMPENGYKFTQLLLKAGADVTIKADN